MDNKNDVENVEQSASQLLPQDQLKLVARISERLSEQVGQGSQVSLQELQRMEAEWVTRELEDFVRLIQRYRALYVTAIFLALGWSLGQVVNTPGGATIDSFRLRTDVAAILCIVPLLNVFYVTLMLEAYAQMKSLARYRFILGFALGDGQPPWRWEIWKESEQGSIKYWTAPLNIFSFFIVIMLTIGALTFPFPAIRNSSSGVLWALWLIALISTVGLVCVLVIVGYRNRNRNAVADPPSVHWSSLWPRSENDVNDQTE